MTYKQERRVFDYERAYRGTRIPSAIETARQVQEKLDQQMARRRKWDPHWLGLAHYMSRVSKDPSTKVGAVIVRPDMTLASVGYNGFARGMGDHDHLYQNREEKYPRIIHGEMNAILNAHGPVDGCTLYTTPFAPCDRCAVFVIQAGIRRVVAPTIPAHLEERWGEALAKTASYFEEAGIEFNLLDVDLDALLPTPQD